MIIHKGIQKEASLSCKLASFYSAHYFVSSLVTMLTPTTPPMSAART